MVHFAQHLLIVLFPLIISNVLHMVVVKLDHFSFLKQPISNSLFGANKTWRGFLLLPLINALLVFVTGKLFIPGLPMPFSLGLLLGLAYVLFELPNSYVKRKVRIEPGSRSELYPYFFTFVDKTDSAFGVTLVYYLTGLMKIQHAIPLFLCCSLAHVLFSFVLVNLKLKSRF